MNNVCFNHFDQAAVGQCVQCGKAICANCHQEVAGRSVCTGCVESIRARLAPQIDSASSPGAPPAQRNIYASSGAAAVSSANEDTVPPGMRLFFGIAAAVLVGIFGAILWEKVVYYTNFNIGYLTALIGFAVGYALVWGSHRTGLLPAILGAVIAFLAQMLGYIVLVNDYIARDMPNIGHVPVDRIIAVLPHMIDPIGWIIIAIGTWLGFKTPMRAVRN